MFDFFTRRLNRVMKLATAEAIGFRHEFLGTEHILLAMLREKGVAAIALASLKVDSEAVRREVESIVKRGPSDTFDPSDDYRGVMLPFTPRAKKGVEDAMDLAQQLGHTKIGTGHLLIGIVVSEQGIAGQVFCNLGIGLDDVRARVRESLATNTDEPDGALAGPNA